MAHISEVAYGGGADFVEIAVVGGTDTADWSVVVYNNGGQPTATAGFDAPAASAGGEDLYLFDGAGELGGIGPMHGVALVDAAGEVRQFASFEGNAVTARKGPADGETSRDIGSAGRGESLTTVDGGATYAAGPPTPGTKPCFLPGTRILTPDGPRPVEGLRPGEPVRLADGGVAPILLAAALPCRLRGPGDPRRPVRLPPGALGPGRPARALDVSPQHELAVSSRQLAELRPIGAAPAAVRARALLGLRGVARAACPAAITYHALLLPRHAALIAEGAEAYSLWPGPLALRALGPAARARLEALFPGISADPARAYGPRAVAIARRDVRRVLGRAERPTRPAPDAAGRPRLRAARPAPEA
jgi:hypothetical protein